MLDWLTGLLVVIVLSLLAVLIIVHIVYGVQHARQVTRRLKRDSDVEEEEE